MSKKARVAGVISPNKVCVRNYWCFINHPVKVRLVSWASGQSSRLINYGCPESWTSSKNFSLKGRFPWRQ